MKKLKSTIVALTFGIIGFAAISISADELKERHVMVEIHKLSDSNTKVDLNVNGEVQAFNLPDLEIGETRDITTESGNTISVTKTESGITVNINGEDINLPAVGSDMSAHIMKGGMPLHTINNGIQVIGDLTEEQTAIINDAFKAAGVEKNVHFTKGHEMKFFMTDDTSLQDAEHVQKWLSKDGENVKIIKLENSNGEIHKERRVIIIEHEEENN